MKVIIYGGRLLIYLGIIAWGISVDASVEKHCRDYWFWRHLSIVWSTRHNWRSFRFEIFIKREMKVSSISSNIDYLLHISFRFPLHKLQDCNSKWIIIKNLIVNYYCDSSFIFTYIFGPSPWISHKSIEFKNEIH